jgi:hypothetical protein
MAVRAFGALFAAGSPGRSRANTADEIAELQRRMSRLIAEIRIDHVIEADQLAALLHRYRSVHGTDTVESSLRPAPLRKAIGVLVGAMRAVRDRLPAAAPGLGPAVLIVDYAGQMSDLVLLRSGSTRLP